MGEEKREEERVCVVLYKRLEGSLRYAVLHRVKNWEGWELVKGHLEDDAEETARQEIREEAGIEELESLQPLDHEMSWNYTEEGEEIHVTCQCFLAEAPQDANVSVDQNPHEEHEEGYFLNFRDARDILTHTNQKELLEKSHRMLEPGSI